MRRLLFLITSCVLCSACEAAEALKVLDRLMPVEYSRSRPTNVEVSVILIHFSSDVKAHPDQPFNVTNVIKVFEDYKVSAHFLIDREGNVFRLVDENRQAFHAGKGVLPWIPNSRDRLNEISIGIELLAIGSKNDMKPFLQTNQYDLISRHHPEYIGYTSPQYASLGKLIRNIHEKFPKILEDHRHIVGHSAYALGRKTDPGELFDWDQIGIRRDGFKKAPLR